MPSQHKETAKIFGWINYFENDGRATSWRGNVIKECEEAVANSMGWNVVHITWVIIFNWNCFVLFQTPFSEWISFLFRVSSKASKKCAAAIAELLLLHNKESEGQAKNIHIEWVANVNIEFIMYSKPFEPCLVFLVQKHHVSTLTNH